MWTIRRLNQAKKDRDRLKKEADLAKQILSIEGQNTITKEQIKLMDKAQKTLVKSEIKGLRQGLKKSLPDLSKLREESGVKQMSGYLNSVRTRALASE